MDVSQINNSDVRNFFLHQDTSLPYKSAQPFSTLHAPHPWETYKNFKTKTHLPWMPLNLKKLGRDFPAEAILKEARAIESMAVMHKSDGNGSKGWKSLCLHGLGTQSTLSCDEYGYKFDHETPYQWTEAAERCPITTLYFKNIFPHTRYNRLRFMYLEPGGYITPHEDVIDEKPHFTAINIAVNQPQNCTFLMGVPDFHSDSRWGIVPFERGGDCFWLDLRNHHSVVNLSSETRIHIIVHFLLNTEDTPNLQHFISMLPQQDLRRIPKKNIAHKKINIALGLWQPKIDSFQEGLQPYIDMTERFSNSVVTPTDLKAKICSANIDEIISEATKVADAEYLFLLGPGQIIFQNEAFWNELANELTNPDNQDVALWAHIIDKGDDSYLGLHPQMLCLDLKKYRTYGTGVFGDSKDSFSSLKNWIRSPENIHDDYTPTFVRPADDIRNAQTRRPGWALIDETLRANFGIRNFSQFIRDTKIHGYPEENFQELAKFSRKSILQKVPEEGPLFEGQVTFLNWLKEEIGFVNTNIWVYNNESVQNLPDSLRELPMSFFAGPSAGNLDFSYFNTLNRTSDFKFIHFDISKPNLDFKKSIVHDLKKIPFQIFLLNYLRGVSPEITVTERKPLLREHDYDELRRLPSWESYLNATHHFIEQDLLSNCKELIAQIPTQQPGIVHLSNIFCFLPAIWLYTEQETQYAFLYLLKKIKEKNKNVYILGKAPCNTPIHFEKIDTLVERLLKDKGEQREGFFKRLSSQFINFFGFQ